MTAPRPAHQKALEHLMRYLVSTKNRGLVIAPSRVWNCEPDFEFRIHGRSDSDYATNPDDRRSVSGSRVFVEDAPVIFRSAMQRTVTLSVTESDQSAGIVTAQDMIYCLRIMTSMRLKVKVPMLLEMDNKGVVDLANNFSSGGRTRHLT